MLSATKTLLVTEYKMMSKNITSTKFKDLLINDCTNHLAVQLKQSHAKNQPQQTPVNSSYEMPLTDIVTCEFIRGYN